MQKSMCVFKQGLFPDNYSDISCISYFASKSTDQVFTPFFKFGSLLVTALTVTSLKPAFKIDLANKARVIFVGNLCEYDVAFC